MKLSIIFICLVILQVNGNYHFLYKSFNKILGIIDHFGKFFLSPHYKIANVKENESFDFIVVGGGTSGSVLANRLTEIDSWNVLLIEAGDVPNYLLEIPAAAALFHFSKFNWQYKTERQDNFGLGLQDQILEWPRGKGLGGSSLINYLIAVRGNPLDYDHWAKLGNPGWSYKDMLPYFKKLEKFHAPVNDQDYHGFSGNLDISLAPDKTKSAFAYIKGAKEVGLNNIDYNGKKQLGVSLVQGTLRNGLRCSAEKAYLRPIRHRKNLKILTNSHVTKVLIDPNTKKAYGVEYHRNGKFHQVLAEKEVILSAGAFHSPQILMLSGVGPKQDLENFKIETLANLPVGKKIYDHLPFVGLIFTSKKPISNLFNYLTPISIGKFLTKRTGPLTRLGAVVEAITYIKTNVTKTEDTFSDMELLYTGGGFATDYGMFFRTSFRISDNSYMKFFKPLQLKYTFQIFPTLIHPKSFGNVTLKSANPLDPPLLFGNYLTDEKSEDVQNLIAGVRKAQEIVQTPAWQKFGAQPSPIPIPGCQHLEFDSDPYWECGIRHLTPSFHHQVSTCKMGPEDDTEAIVNHKAQVWGIGNLRVVDLSIAPITFSAHTYVPAIVIAERAVDIIKEDWGVDINPSTF